MKELCDRCHTILENKRSITGDEMCDPCWDKLCRRYIRETYREVWWSKAATFDLTQ